MRRALQAAVIVGVSAICAGAYAVPTDLTGGDYYYDIPDQPGNVTTISFNYDSNGNPIKFDIKGLTDPGNPDVTQRGSWMMPVRHDGDNGNVQYIDTDYGPYGIGSISEAGSHLYAFTLNQANGQFTVSVDGSPVTLTTIAGATTFPQADGTHPTDISETVPQGYFSDETLTAGQNAVGLGWATWVDINDPGQGLSGNAEDGVGGIGAYQLRFYQADGGSAEVVPEPTAIALLGLAGLAGLTRRRRA